MLLSEQVVQWTRKWFKENNQDMAILGISGGKDSAVVAAVCAAAFGPENVIGVMMPNGHQPDIADSRRVIDELGIRSLLVNIGPACENLRRWIGEGMGGWGDMVSDEAFINLQPRVRMTTLYTIGQSLGEKYGKNICVVGTGNRAERMIGYTTKHGDSACDMNPIGDLWVDEVIQVGEELGHYPDIVHKAPADGLCGKTDEERVGFTYAQVKLAFTGHADELPANVLLRIMNRYAATRHKRAEVPMFHRDAA